jgi:hypothetical protein
MVHDRFSPSILAVHTTQLAGRSLALLLQAHADFVGSGFGARLMLLPQKEPAERKVAHRDYPPVSFSVAILVSAW